MPNYTDKSNGMTVTRTFDDGSEITFPNPDYNPEPGWGVTVPKAKTSSKPATKATPTPKPKGTQAGHAVTSGKNTTKPVK